MIKAYIKTFIPFLMVKLTGEARHLPNLTFNWKGNVVHSLMMCYYSVFWRRRGIRHGGLMWYQDATGKRKVWGKGLVGTLLLLEHEIIRPALRWKLKIVEIYVPVLAFNTTPFGYHNGVRVPFFFAITFVEGEGAATGVSTSPLIANVEGSGADSLFTIHLNYTNSVSVVPTFASVASTIISVEVNTSDGNAKISSYRLVNPSTSSGNLTATLASSEFWCFLCTCYNGIDQTTPTADEGSNSGSVQPGSPTTASSTSNLNGSWQWVSAKEDSAGTPFTVDSPSQLRQGEDGSPINMLADGATDVNSGNTGSIVMNWTGGGQRIGYQKCMLRPSVAAGPANLKTWDGLAKASIKTMDGLAIGSVKSWNGLT